MTLINLEGLALIGQGSEWFWSMLQFVIVAITLYAIYRQVRLQASAAAIGQMDAIVKDWRSEASLRHTLNIAMALRNGVAPENIPYGSASSIGDFWEGIAYLVRKGHMDRRLLHENLGSSIQWWWAVIAPWIRRDRMATNQPMGLEAFEWLAREMAAMDQRAGVQVAYDEAYIASTLDKRIENEQERLRVAEELRAVIVRPMWEGSEAAGPAMNPRAATARGKSPGRARARRATALHPERDRA